MQPGNNLPTTEIKAVFFRDILTLVLTKNNLHIQKSFWYHQKSGTAMDCLISVFFANAFLFYRMEKILRNPPADLKYLGRYIDDLVGVWTGAPDDIPNLFYTTIQTVRESLCHMESKTGDTYENTVHIWISKSKSSYETALSLKLHNNAAIQLHPVEE